MFHLDFKSGKVLQKINHALGYEANVVEFPAHPVFSQRYALVAGNEMEFARQNANPVHDFYDAPLRRLFNDPVRSFYESNSSLLTECSGNRLIFYRRGTKIAPDQLRNQINEALTATNLFFAAAASGVNRRN